MACPSTPTKPVLAIRVPAAPKKAKPSAPKLVPKARAEQESLVDGMTDDELFAEFTRLTGCIVLGCKHCKRTDLPLERMSMGIRASAKKGLTPEMHIPKTCNIQLTRNAVSNPINNRFTALLKAATEEEKVVLKAAKKAEAAAARAAAGIVSKNAKVTA